MKLTRTLQNITLLGIAAITFAALSGTAIAAPAVGGSQFGSVDINKIQAESTKKAAYDSTLHDMATRLDAQFKQQAAYVMLSKDEQVQLAQLLAKTNRTDVDNTAVTALEAKATRDAQELTNLQQTKNPSSTDSARMDALTKQYQAGQQALTDIGDGYQAQLKKASDTDNTDFTRSVKEAIATVAQQRGLAVVFTADVAVYTTNDITDEVVKRLNK